MLAKPLISVVLGTYNRLGHLRQCVLSVREGGITVPHEVIVVDGGSTDGSLDWLVRQTDIITIIQHNKIVVDGKMENRRSWGYFMNIAFSAAHAECILMISDDCVTYPGTIMAGYEAFRAASRDVAAVAFRFRNVPLEETFIARRTIHDVLFVNHGMFRKSIFQEMGGFDEDTYEFYKADSDYGLRLLTKGYRTIEAPGTRIDHFLSEDDIRQANRENDQMARDRQAYLARWQDNSPRPSSPMRRLMNRLAALKTKRHSR